MLRRKPKYLPFGAKIRECFAAAQHDSFELRLSTDQVFRKSNQSLFLR